ncbi:hypothetical protein ACXR0O_08860 [Verrucomicrobiota bacterium sgz303538]
MAGYRDTRSIHAAPEAQERTYMEVPQRDNHVNFSIERSTLRTTLLIIAAWFAIMSAVCVGGRLALAWWSHDEAKEMEDYMRRHPFPSLLPSK